jgi:hypothetical protein
MKTLKSQNQIIDKLKMKESYSALVESSGCFIMEEEKLLSLKKVMTTKYKERRS